MKKYQYILWDMDGTISNTYEGVSRSLMQAFERYGIEWEGDYSCFIGPPMRESLPQYAGVPEDLVEDVIAKFRERYNPIGVYECELFPGVRETLEAFQNAGTVQVIASSKPEERCREIVRQFELTDLFNDVVGASMDGRIDTKIEVLDEAFRRFRERDPHFAKEDCVLIGDTKYDADGAREAGIDCIGVGYGFGTTEEMLEHGAIKVYEDLAELVEELS